MLPARVPGMLLFSVHVDLKEHCRLGLLKARCYSQNNRMGRWIIANVWRNY